MSKDIQKEFITKIINNLETNGFPDKKVSLPLEKMYEVADSKGLNFNNVLEEMNQLGISHETTVEKVIFSKMDVDQSNAQDSKNNMFGDLNMDSLKDMDQADLMSKVQEMMKSMSPEQMSEIKNMYENMSPEEKDEVMKKGKDMGLV